jgi:hypothetical protein
MPGGVEHDNHDSQLCEAHGRNEYKCVEREQLAGWLVVDRDDLKNAPTLSFAGMASFFSHIDRVIPQYALKHIRNFRSAAALRDWTRSA